MPRFRKKPVVIEAMQLSPSNHAEILNWIVANGGEADRGVGSYQGRAAEIVRISTLEGIMAVSDPGWVIRGVQGEFYPCDSAIFAATYEPVSDQ